MKGSYELYRPIYLLRVQGTDSRFDWLAGCFGEVMTVE